MDLQLRLALIAGALLIFALICVQVRRRAVRVGDSVFWIGFAAVLVFFAIFPQVAYAISDLVGIQSPSNFVFAVLLAVLILLTFQNTSRISRLNSKLDEMAGALALLQMRERPTDEEGDSHARADDLRKPQAPGQHPSGAGDGGR